MKALSMECFENSASSLLFSFGLESGVHGFMVKVVLKSYIFTLWVWMIHFLVWALAITIGSFDDVSSAIVVTKESIVTRVVSNNKVDPRFATNISIHDCGIDATTKK